MKEFCAAISEATIDPYLPITSFYYFLLLHFLIIVSFLCLKIQVQKYLNVYFPTFQLSHFLIRGMQNIS